MSSIYRLSVDVTDYQEIPLSGRVLSVAADRGGRSDCFDLWYEHTHVQTYDAAIYVFGTGHPTPWSTWTRHAWTFIGTVVTPSGLVWHVFTGPRQGEPIPV